MVKLFSCVAIALLGFCALTGPSSGNILGGGGSVLPGGAPSGGSVPDTSGLVPSGLLSNVLSLLSGLLSKLPNNLLQVLVKVDQYINTNCSSTCLCFPYCSLEADVLSVPSLSLTITGLLEDLKNPSSVLDPAKIVDDLTNKCNVANLTVEICLARVKSCYNDCQDNSKHCNTLLSVCLDAAAVISFLVCPKDTPLIEVCLDAVLNVNLCALFVDSQQTSCSNCLVKL